MKRLKIKKTNVDADTWRALCTSLRDRSAVKITVSGTVTNLRGEERDDIAENGAKEEVSLILDHCAIEDAEVI